MASLLIARGLHSLIASRTPHQDVAWNAIAPRDAQKQEQITSTVVLYVWIGLNIILFVPVFFIVSNLQRVSRISTNMTDNSTAGVHAHEALPDARNR
jgi:heme/copper-type cytochrome/quinol oxidase subunit 2